MKDIGKPDAGKLHVRFDEGRLINDQSGGHVVAACGKASAKVPTNGLISASYSTRCPSLFESFSGNMEPSDFLDRTLPSCSLEFTARTAAPSATISLRISRFPCEKLAYVLGVLDRAGSVCLSRYRDSPFCLPLDLRASAPWIRVFSRLNNRPVRPLSTPRLCPHGYMRMTRGRCGSLFLHRMRLALTTSRRF